VRLIIFIKVPVTEAAELPWPMILRAGTSTS
jgi:hypothetical protein